MKFIKKYSKWFLGILTIILLVALLLIAKEFFYSSDVNAVYGSRIEGIEKVKISEETKNKVKELMGESFASIEIRIQGRIIYVDAKAGPELEPGTARDLGNKSLEAFSPEEKSYYDIQYLISSDTNTAQYPVLGYKHHSKEGINWTRDRAVS
jgi:hypothetical protein